MSWLLSIYIAATVFGVGITVIDLLGFLGGHDGDQSDGIGTDHDGDSGDFAEVDHDGGGAADHDGADHDSAAHEDAGHEPTEHEGSVAGHDRPERRGFVLSLLSALRNLIYFCLGFGPVGWFALATGSSAAGALLYSAPVGVVALIGTRLLRRFMRRELNSEVRESELLMEQGEVTVTIGKGEMGRVRIKLGELYVERYARAASADATIHVGAQVRVTDVGEDCVYVTEE